MHIKYSRIQKSVGNSLSIQNHNVGLPLNYSENHVRCLMNSSLFILTSLLGRKWNWVHVVGTVIGL